jgi:hypothetical protein
MSAPAAFFGIDPFWLSSTLLLGTYGVLIVDRLNRSIVALLIGASANLTVAGIAERNGIPFGFMAFLKLAFPMMLVSVAIAMVYIYLRYLF